MLVALFLILLIIPIAYAISFNDVISSFFSKLSGRAIITGSGLITSSLKCDSGWKCQSTYFKAYKSSTCSWSNKEYCLFGCSNGNCVIKPIKIIGDSTCITKTNEALTLLKNKAALHYNNFIKFVGIIKCVDQGSGIYVMENPPRYIVGKVTMNAGINTSIIWYDENAILYARIWYAGGLVHEACHSKLYHDYLLTHSGSTVPSNIHSGKGAEAICLGAQYDALVKIGASNSTLDYIKNVINTEYWIIPKRDRWW